ncbi:MAG TPA: hypothetical protein VGK75_04535 [Casimicrobiaceae bacterium]|jgi:hypothetical protein
MAVLVAGTFDKFADANAAANELRESGLVDGEVRVTTNPANPGRPETLRWPGTLEMLIRNLFDLDEKQNLRSKRTKAIQRRVVDVSVPVHDADERSIARAVLHRHRALELGNVARGVPVY